MHYYRALPLILALQGALFASPAPAAGLNVLGFDDMSCSAWNKSKDDLELRKTYLAWVRGALSGHNYALPSQQVATLSSGTVEMNINRYCSKNPNGLFSDAAWRMSDEFSGRNQAIRK